MKKVTLPILRLSFLFLAASCAAIRPADHVEHIEKVKWTPPYNVYDSVRDAKGQPVSNPAVAVDQKGNINVVWWAKGFGDVYFSRSTDGGKSFSPAVNISNDPLGSDHPVVATDAAGTIYVVWNNLIPLLPSEVFFSVSKDGGQTWSGPKNISNTPKRDSSRANIAVDSSGAISVVWVESGGGVFFTRSTDGGATWSDTRSVSGEYRANAVFSPALTVDGKDQIYVAWGVPNGQPFTAHSTDGGATFSPPQNISQSKPTASPALAVDGGGILYAVWADGSSGTTEVLLASSTDGGRTFTPPVNISQSPLIPSMEPRIMTDQKGTVWIVWTEFLPGNPEIFVVEHKTGGPPLSQPFNISNAPGNSWLSNIAIGPADDLDLTWEHGMKEAILYTKITKK